MEIAFCNQRNFRIGCYVIIGVNNKNVLDRAMGLMLKRQFFMILLFFFVLFVVRCLKFSVVFGNKDHKTVTIFLVVELVMLYQISKFNQIL